MDAKFKNPLWSIMLILAVLSCHKSIKPDQDTRFIIVRDSTKIEKESKVVAFSLKTVVSSIPDSTAREYIEKYEKLFPEDEMFPKIFVMGKKSYKKILNSTNSNGLCKLLLTEKDSTLSLIYQDGNNRELNFDFNGFAEIEDSEYDNMNSQFKQNLNNILNSRITKLAGSATPLQNTNKITIPISEFKNLNVTDSRDFILLFPAVITKNTDTSTGLVNQKNYITLIIGVWKFDGKSLTFQRMSYLYDNFCVSPPNNC